LGRADNTKFLEQFRYIIVASQLLSEHAYHGQGVQLAIENEWTSGTVAPHLGGFNLTGAAITATVAFGIVWMLHWVRRAGSKSSASGRAAVAITIFVVLATSVYAYVRRQWLQYLRQQTLVETSSFVAKAQGLDAAISAAVTLIQEVELVSRGYRMYLPLNASDSF
jgi:Mysoin-binding motif of peroxisomes